VSRQSGVPSPRFALHDLLPQCLGIADLHPRALHDDWRRHGAVIPPDEPQSGGDALLKDQSQALAGVGADPDTLCTPLASRPPHRHGIGTGRGRVRAVKVAELSHRVTVLRAVRAPMSGQRCRRRPRALDRRWRANSGRQPHCARSSAARPERICGTPPGGALDHRPPTPYRQPISTCPKLSTPLLAMPVLCRKVQGYVKSSCD